MPTLTNWVFDNFDLIQEAGGNLLTEDGFYISLEEFNTSVWGEESPTANAWTTVTSAATVTWTEETDTGNG